MTRQNPTLTLSKSNISDQRFAAGLESSPKNDSSRCVLQDLPSYLGSSKVVSLILRVESFGSWETPREQWVTGLILTSTTTTGSERYVKSFYLSQQSIRSIKQECSAIAQVLKTTLIDTTINHNVED